MRRDNLDSAARLRDAMKLRDKGHHVGHVFDNMAADNLIELIVAERIRHDTKVVNHIGMAARVRVDAYSAGVLVLSASDVKDSVGPAIRRFQLCGGLSHSNKDGGVSLGKHGGKGIEIQWKNWATDLLAQVLQRGAVEHDLLVAFERGPRNDYEVAANPVACRQKIAPSQQPGHRHITSEVAILNRFDLKPRSESIIQLRDPTL